MPVKATVNETLVDTLVLIELSLSVTYRIFSATTEKYSQYVVTATGLPLGSSISQAQGHYMARQTSNMAA